MTRLWYDTSWRRFFFSLFTVVSFLFQARPCVMDDRVQQAVEQATGSKHGAMFEMYGKYWHPFGLLLTDMEKEGMSVNRSA